MKLETRITVYKKKDSGVFSRLIAGSPDYYIDSIEVIISDAFRIFVHPNKHTDFRKFKRTPERLIHEINKNLKNIQFFSYSYYAAWTPYEYEATDYVVYLEQSDIEKVKLGKEEKNKIRRALNVIPKRGVVYNPSKDKPEMEYRKRAYYGKCKKW